MKKLVERAVNNDNFTFLRAEELRTEVRAILETKVFAQPFPRKLLLDMSLLEAMSLWMAAAKTHDSKQPVSERKGEMALVQWLHSAVAQLIVLHFNLDKLSKRTDKVLPENWASVPICDLIADGGRLNVECTTPEGGPGRQHTIPLWKLKLVVSQSGADSWYETI